MRAVVLDAPGPPEALELRELPRPRPAPGIGYLPNGVRLSAYGGDAADLPAPVLQSWRPATPPASLSC